MNGKFAYVMWVFATMPACSGSRAIPAPELVPVPVAAAQPEPAQCVTPEEVTKRQVQFDADFEAAGQRLLQERGLTPVELELQSRRAHSGTKRSSHEEELPPMGPAFVRGGTTWSTRRPEPEWTFVQDDEGNIYRPEFKPAAYLPVTIQYCDCPPPDCSGGSGCPGCFDTYEHWYGPLPEGTSYKDVLLIEVPEKHNMNAVPAPECPKHECRAKP